MPTLSIRARSAPSYARNQELRLGKSGPLVSSSRPSVRNSPKSRSVRRFDACLQEDGGEILRAGGHQEAGARYASTLEAVLEGGCTVHQAHGPPALALATLSSL